jgi:CRISPR/Cas system-associated exonuclease Cas4 (RecB family)
MSESELSEIKVDVGVLKTQVLTLSALCNKMDQVIEKLVDQHDRHISKVYDNMDNQRKEKDDDISEIHERIDVVLDKVQETESRIMGEIKGLKETMGKHVETSKSQYEQLNKWKWTIVGGILVITWLFSKTNIDTILHSLK